MARLLGCEPTELKVLFDRNNTCNFLRFDRRDTETSTEKVDAWVFKKRTAFLSQKQLHLVKPSSVSTKRVSRRTQELKALVPAQRLPKPSTLGLPATAPNVVGAMVDASAKVAKITEVYNKRGSLGGGLFC